MKSQLNIVGHTSHRKSTSPAQDSISREILFWMKQSHSDNQYFCNFVSRLNSFDELDQVFEGGNLQRYFPANHQEVQRKLVSTILMTDDDSAGFLVRKFDLARRIISRAQDNCNPALAFSVISSLFSMSLHPDTGDQDKVS